MAQNDSWVMADILVGHLSVLLLYAESQALCAAELRPAAFSLCPLWTLRLSPRPNCYAMNTVLNQSVYLNVLLNEVFYQLVRVSGNDHMFLFADFEGAGLFVKRKKFAKHRVSVMVSVGHGFWNEILKWASTRSLQGITNGSSKQCMLFVCYAIF